MKWHKLYDCPVCKSNTRVMNVDGIVNYICTSCNFRFNENDIKELFGDVIE